MEQRMNASPQAASTIEAVFSHAEEFDYIDLRLAFDGFVFSSTPSSSNHYDGHWEDLPCEHADLLVYFSSVFCAFRDFMKFLEAIAVGVQQCRFHWDAEGPDGCFSWHRSSYDGTGCLSATWQSRASFRYVVRIDGKQAVRTLYGAFREFVESEAYDPIRYERMTIGETLSHVLEYGDFEKLPAELSKLDARGANTLLNNANGGPDQREIRGPKQRYPLSHFLANLDDDALSKNEPLEGMLTAEWVPAEWDEWSPEKRLQEVGAIMALGDGPWWGENLREIRSVLVEAWLENESAT